ncbi:hypothetical protein JTB14_021544 [Gonioctena quinquepunctata]|nr:hypothetical protein JTB14_021544 [Gonioctena quinquepunctata]
MSAKFSRQELDFALTARINTAPGYDNIKYPMLTNLSDNAKNFLLDIFNELFEKGYSINLFKQVLVVPILKPGKNPNLAQSYRPITLLSCILKTLERMIKNRLEWWLLQKKNMPCNQFAYKKGFGTLDAVSTVVVDIQNNFSRNNYLATLFLDIERAYDAVSLPILKQKMFEQFDIPIHVAHVIVDFYSGRQIKTSADRMERHSSG